MLGREGSKEKKNKTKTQVYQSVTGKLRQLQKKKLFSKMQDFLKLTEVE